MKKIDETTINRLTDALRGTAAALLAAISLLEHGGKKAAASDRMFAQMLIDYKRALGDARAVLIDLDKPAEDPDAAFAESDAEHLKAWIRTHSGERGS